MLPLSLEASRDDESIARILLFGPPASGKTSLMLKIYATLLARCSPSALVYFVRAGELRLRRQEVTIAISRFPNCIVLLDDAQEWCGYRDFFLFKATSRLLMAAATYFVEQFNPSAPVEFQKREKSNLIEEEVAPLLESLNVDSIYRNEMMNWFGDVYGRFHILVPALLSCWSSLKRTNPEMTLCRNFLSRSHNGRSGWGEILTETLSRNPRQLLKVWRGTAKSGDCKRLMPYGVFDANGERWSCEYVRRKYFLKLFHDTNPDETLFDANDLSSGILYTYVTSTGRAKESGRSPRV